MKRIARSALTLGLVIGTAGLAACQKSGGDDAPPPPKVLIQSDRDLLAKDGSEGAEDFDRSNRNLFSKIFGGTSGRDVTRYLDERLRYYFDDADLDGWDSKDRPVHTKWSDIPKPKNSEEDQPSTSGRRVKAEVGASNIGTALFFQGAVDGAPFTITKGEKRIVFDSTRVGMMHVGPGYKARVDLNGKRISIPAAYRQAILIHEARHSDCSVSASAEDFSVAHGASNYVDFLSRFKKIECGHAHVLCPGGHDFAGLPACDRQPWGAYSIGAVFLAARTRDAKSELDQRILEGEATSALSRLLFDKEDMRDGKMGEPQMKQMQFKW